MVFVLVTILVFCFVFLHCHEIKRTTCFTVFTVISCAFES